MCKIDQNGVITIRRGECFQIPLFINVGTKEEPNRLDIRELPSAEIYLGIYTADSKFENSLVRKKYTLENVNEYGDMLVTFVKNDTNYIQPGKYFYEVKLRLYNKTDGEFVSTVINKTPCYII